MLTCTPGQHYERVLVYQLFTCPIGWAISAMDTGVFSLMLKCDWLYLFVLKRMKPTCPDILGDKEKKKKEKKKMPPSPKLL